MLKHFPGSSSLLFDLFFSADDMFFMCMYFWKDYYMGFIDINNDT